MPDQELTIGVNVVNLEEVKELRKELERIKELKEEIKEIQEDEDDSTTHPTDFPDIGDPNPNPFPDPQRPKRPRFWVSVSSDGEVTEFDPFENDEDVKAETSFQV